MGSCGLGSALRWVVGGGWLLGAAVLAACGARTGLGVWGDSGAPDSGTDAEAGRDADADADADAGCPPAPTPIVLAPFADGTGGAWLV
jgi:hypothetical protein